MKKSPNLVILLSLLVVIFGLNYIGCNESSGTSKEQAASSLSNGKSDSGEDICEVEGWYGDGTCDVFCPTADPDCEQQEFCKPICDAIGSRSEGWYDSCSGELIGWAQCNGCNAICQAVGSRSEGWYDSCESGINGTGLIRWEKCGEPQECPETDAVCDPYCGPNEKTIEGAPCQKGIFNQDTCECEPIPEVCKPVCDAIGSRSEGWYNSCTGDLIGWSQCSGCTAECQAIGSKSEGWYDSCGNGLNGTGLITWEDCGDDTTEPEVCKPVCDAIGSRSEGWYDSCSGNLIGWYQCENCEVTCTDAGTRSEGWSFSCDDGATTGLITWAECGE